MTRSLVFPHVALALFMSVFITGCASIPGTQSHAIVSQSYDLPGTLEANAVIRAVEQAFTTTFSKPPGIAEGSVPATLPVKPAPFTVEDRLVHLDRLGVVSIPEVVCPASMAVVRTLEAVPSESSGPHSYIGCIQVYEGGYRVHFVESVMSVLERRDSPPGAMESGAKSGADRLVLLAQALRDQIAEARVVDEPRVLESTARTDRKPATAEQEAPLASPPEQSATTHATYREEEAVSTVPLVCLSPRRESAPVRAARGEGHVITVLESGSVLAVAEPVDASYFRVQIEDGTAGWVNHSDVRRLPCPIG